jgi:hypothetical protein
LEITITTSRRCYVGWAALKKKKELLSELEFREVLEEDNILSGDQYARK